MFKKILALIICFSILYAPAYCIIQDEFIDKTLNKNMQIKNVQKAAIKDDFADKTLNKNLVIKTAKNKNIEDGFGEQNTNKNSYTKPKIDLSEHVVNLIDNTESPKKAEVYKISENNIPVKIKVKKRITTRSKIDEGDYIEFETLTDLKIKNKLYPAGTTIKARVETISQNKIWGVPADLIIGNFTLDGNLLNGEINKTGANRSLWLYPTICVTTFCFGLGLLLIPIRGGHAKITPTQTYTVNYFD